MPYWLKRQLMRAFQSKDRRQVRILNDCWYLYRHNHQPSFYDDEKSNH